ncbi:hypothetical protein BJ165DRAFT_1408687 [Panaeolus papilionaceus]|nr:hypothetical protein BJ165DRAFT_1408687 [Panaeolus papilionaceus]
MSSLTLSKAPSTAQTRNAYSRVKRRWLHGSLRRQAIMMPAMSPLMTEGTVTRWKKKEGEAFEAGDVLLEIVSTFFFYFLHHIAQIGALIFQESEYATIDVQAEKPGIIGKILVPDGTTNVPIEQIIAIVAKDSSELPLIQGSLHLPPAMSSVTGPPVPPYNPIPTPPSLSLKSPRGMEPSRIPLASPRSPTRSMSRSPRTPSLFEMHTMGYGARSLHLGSSRRLRPDRARRASTMGIEIPSSQMSHVIATGTPTTPCTAQWPRTPSVPGSMPSSESDQVDAAAIRRMIVSNLSSRPSKSIEFEDLL